MASGDSKHQMSDETFDYICTSCAEEDLIKEAIKYCLVCQRYCCHDCVRAHKGLPMLKGHTLLDTASGPSQGQPSGSLPAFPTEQCSIHKGKILDMYCGNHNVVACYVCVAMDHKDCKDLHSVTDDVDKLYKKSDTVQTRSDLTDSINTMEAKRKTTLKLLQQLRDSKTKAFQSVKDYRSEIEKYLDDLEDASIKDIEREYRKMESELLEERKMYDKYIEELKKLEDQLGQSEGNTAQRFVCTKLARRKLMSGNKDEKTQNVSVVVSFIPVVELRKLVEGLTSLGQSSVNTTSAKCDLYQTKLINTIELKLKNDTRNCSILGSCIVDDTVLFTDNTNKKVKRVDIASLYVVDSCKLPDGPNGVCRVGALEVAVACINTVQFVSIHTKLTVSRHLKMEHICYGIAYNKDKLYITDENESLYMYSMSGKLLKTITNDKHGQPLFVRSNHIVFNDCGDRMFVGDDCVGLVCFDANCDHFMTITDFNAEADGVCVDGRGNIIVVNYVLNTISQLSQDRKKRVVIVSRNVCMRQPRSVCVHQTLTKMFVPNTGNKVQVYELS